MSVDKQAFVGIYMAVRKCGPALLDLAELTPGFSSWGENVFLLCTAVLKSMMLFLPTLLAKGCWLIFQPNYRKHKGVEQEWGEKEEIPPFNFKQSFKRKTGFSVYDKFGLSIRVFYLPDFCYCVTVHCRIRCGTSCDHDALCQAGYFYEMGNAAGPSGSNRPQELLKP